MKRCALCGMDLTEETYRFAVVVLHKNDAPDPLILTREVCERCANPEQRSELVTTIRRLPSILPEGN